MSVSREQTIGKSGRGTEKLKKLLERLPCDNSLAS